MHRSRIRSNCTNSFFLTPAEERLLLRNKELGYLSLLPMQNAFAVWIDNAISASCPVAPTGALLSERGTAKDQLKELVDELEIRRELIVRLKGVGKSSYAQTPLNAVPDTCETPPATWEFEFPKPSEHFQPLTTVDLVNLEDDALQLLLAEWSEEIIQRRLIVLRVSILLYNHAIALCRQLDRSRRFRSHVVAIQERFFALHSFHPPHKSRFPQRHSTFGWDGLAA